MNTSAIEIRRLGAPDVERAAGILSAAFGPSSWEESVQRNLALQPEGMLLAEQAGQALGVVGAVDFGPFAYIGMMGVHPEAQRRGVARLLMTELLAWLDGRGCPAALLDATASGAPLYEQLGFTDAGTSYVTERKGPADAAELPRQVAHLAPPELDALAAFDAPIFGADRRAVLALLRDASPERVFVARDDRGAISGYVVAQPRVIGPWVARTPDDAGRLLRAALTCPFEQPPRVLVPGGNPAAVPLLGDHGFAVQRELRYMLRGPGRRPGDPSGRYGQLSFALG